MSVYVCIDGIYRVPLQNHNKNCIDLKSYCILLIQYLPGDFSMNDIVNWIQWFLARAIGSLSANTIFHNPISFLCFFIFSLLFFGLIHVLAKEALLKRIKRW